MVTSSVSGTTQNRRSPNDLLVGMGRFELRPPAPKAGALPDCATSRIGGQEVGCGLGLSKAERRERRVGWTVVSLVGFRQGVPDDDQLHEAGT